MSIAYRYHQQLINKKIELSARDILNYLERRNWKMLLHPGYSPDLGPSDYGTKYYCEQHFVSYQAVQKGLDEWFASK